MHTRRVRMLLTPPPDSYAWSCVDSEPLTPTPTGSWAWARLGIFSVSSWNLAGLPHGWGDASWSQNASMRAPWLDLFTDWRDTQKAQLVA